MTTPSGFDSSTAELAQTREARRPSFLHRLTRKTDATAHPTGDRRLVAVLSCDGFDRGGIGRWTAYICDAWAHSKIQPGMIMIDTRAASGRRISSSFVFAKVLSKLLWL